MAEINPKLAGIARAYGVATGYADWQGRPRVVAEATVLACLAALGVDTSGDDWIERAQRQLDERPWRRPLPPCTVVETGQAGRVDVHVAAGHTAQARVELEDGGVVVLEQADNWEPDRLIDDAWIGRASFTVPELPLGYHRLVLLSDDQSWTAPYIVTPSSLDLAGLRDRPAWGLMTQFYSVASQASWGLGDFVDLRDLAVWAKTSHGADVVLINPIHAAEVMPRLEPSPYLPASRGFLNPWYIRPEAIEEYATANAEVRREVGLARAVARAVVDAEPLIDRDAVWTAKQAALRAIWSLGRSVPRQAMLDDFTRRGGQALRRYATWCALARVFGPRWTDWPADLRDPASDAVAAFAHQAGDDIDFFTWLQWVAHTQVTAAQQAARQVGMTIGVMADLAVGVNRVGEETWSQPDLFATAVSVGAPPDDYNQAGQDWRQPPWRPDRLEQTGYEPFRRVIRTALSYAGAIRVDHIIGWFRLWWVPQGMSAAEGTYVSYDHAAMIGILALEVARADAVAVGEDLGTVDPAARRYLARRGVLGTSVLWFERDDQGHLIPAPAWRQISVASVTTHDLPPTLGYLAQDHIRLRHDLGLVAGGLDDALAADAHDQAQVRQGLIERGLLTADQTDPPTVMRALYRYLDQSPAVIKLISLADVVGDTRAQNQPGTTDQYPNWRLPLADAAGRRLGLEDLYALDTPPPGEAVSMGLVGW